MLGKGFPYRERNEDLLLRISDYSVFSGLKSPRSSLFPENPLHASLTAFASLRLERLYPRSRILDQRALSSVSPLQ